MKKPYFIYLPKLVFIKYLNDTYLFYEYQDYLYPFGYIFPNVYGTSRVCDRIFNKDGDYLVDVVKTFWTTSFTSSINFMNDILQTPNWWETYNEDSLWDLIRSVGYCNLTKFVISKTKDAEEKLSQIKIMQNTEPNEVIESIVGTTNKLLDYYKGLKNES